MGTPPFVFRDNSESKMAGEVGSVRLDICLFHTGDRNKGNFFNIKVEREAGQVIFTDPSSNPLSDHRFAVDTRSPEECLKCRISALGQMEYHAHVVQARQSPTCVFSLTISGSTARIMRWDRSGVLVTQAFDYKSDLKMMIEIHQRGPQPARFRSHCTTRWIRGGP